MLALSHTVLHVVLISSLHFLLMLKLLLLSALLAHLGVVELKDSRVLEGKPAYLTWDLLFLHTPAQLLWLRCDRRLHAVQQLLLPPCKCIGVDEIPILTSFEPQFWRHKPEACMPAEV